MKIKILLLTICQACLYTSCMFDSGGDNIIGDYELAWIDLPKNRCINKGEQIVPEYVKEVGHNQNYIIAKQNPVNLNNNTQINTAITNYYIITVSANKFQDKPVYGPLNKITFDSLRQKFQIENIQFDMN